MIRFRLSRRRLLAATPLLSLPLGGGRAAAAAGDFSAFLAGVKRDALSQGIRPATVDAALRYAQFDSHVLELDKKQPERRLTFAEFIDKVVNQQRIDSARDKLAENSQMLQRVRQRFNVQPGFIIALWGIESDFGRTTGNYPVVSALATLAYDGRRASFFRPELIAAMRILDQGHIRPNEMTGSWAGAMGQCQFMPSTFLSYAVDFDGDGRRDIWTDRADVFGSIANYLARLGWHGDESWGQEVRVPGNIDTGLTGLESRRPLADWSRLGVRAANGGPLGGNGRDASLLVPDGPSGRAILVTDNFRAIMKWNKSVPFAASVGMIADNIARG
jgi:membrane-bound lytic murein transglycosylase B